MPKKIAGNGRKTSMIGRRACCCEHLINSKRDQGIVKPRPAAALTLVSRHGLLRGEIDAEIIILMVVSVFILYGVAALFFKW
jgi:hypothetical protein